MAWKDLSIAQRSQLMNLMRHNGITSLSEMRRVYDNLTPSLFPLVENSSSLQSAPVYKSGGDKEPQIPFKNSRKPIYEPIKVLETMGRMRPNLPQVQAKTPPISIDLTPEIYDMVPLMYDVPVIGNTYVPENNAMNLFSDEEVARRKLKQRYAESTFNDSAKSGVGAIGAYQIMPITYQDYLGRGRGKEGNLLDPAYNEKVRDWYMGIIPRDLKDLYSENDAPEVKLAKIYGAYNWGTGNMRKYLRKQRDAGIDISNDTTWVEGLNPETRRYIKYLALNQDIEDSPYTNEKFENAARQHGYLASGGHKIHIKKENRGKFTALKKRTGKSASWFKAHGTPAQKKMAVFALNAKKWKHSHGGIKF